MVVLFVKKQRALMFVELQAIHLVDSAAENRKKLVPFLGDDGPIKTGDEDGDAVRFHSLQCRENTVKDVPDFAQRSLFVIQRIKQTEDERCAGMNGF